jgi:hypothetical protein
MTLKNQAMQRNADTPTFLEIDMAEAGSALPTGREIV